MLFPLGIKLSDLGTPNRNFHCDVFVLGQEYRAGVPGTDLNVVGVGSGKKRYEPAISRQSVRFEPFCDRSAVF